MRNHRLPRHGVLRLRVHSTGARLMWVAAVFVSMVFAWPTTPASAAPLPGVTMAASYGGSQVVTELPVGAAFEYLVNYTCATENCVNYSVSIPFPAGLVIGNPNYGSDIVSYTRTGSTSTGTTLTFQMVASIAPGTSGQFAVPASTPAFTTVDNTVLTATATMSSTEVGAPTSTSGAVTLTARADISLRTVASRMFGSVVDDVTRYSAETCLDAVQPSNVWGLLGTEPNSTLVAALPRGAVVADAAGGTFTAGSPDTLTWTLPARSDSFCARIQPEVRFPSSDPDNVVGASKTFSIAWTATELGKLAATYTDAVTHTLDAPSGPPGGSIFQATLSTPRNYGSAPTQKAAVGNSVSISASVGNPGTSTMTSAIVEVPVPTIVRPTSIVSSNGGTSTATVEIITTCGADRTDATTDDNTWEPAATVNVGATTSWNPATTWPNGSPGINPSCHVVSTRVTTNGLTPGRSTNPISFTGIIQATGRDGVPTNEFDDFSSVATLIVTTLGGTGTRTSQVDGEVDLPKSTLFVNSGGPGTLSPGVTEGDLTLSFNNSGNPLLNPVMTSLLPLNTSLVSWSGGSGWSGAPTPTKTEILDWAGSGRTLVRWTFPSGTTVPVDSGYTVNFRVTLSPFAYGRLFAAGRVDSASTSVLCVYDFFHAGVDADDFDGDGNTTEQTCRWDAEISPNPSASAAVTSMIKGSYDSAFVANPTVGQSTPGSDDSYRIVVTNNGRIELDNVTVVDVLPRPGDEYILTSAARNPATGTFPVVLRGTPSLPLLATAPVLHYSTVAAACQPELGYAPTGCTAPAWTNWAITPPTALDAVTMVRADFGPNILKPGFSYTLELPVTTPPAGATEPDFASANPNPLLVADEAATNSAAFRARRVDNQSLLNAAEPPGVRLAMPGVLGPMTTPPTPGPIATSGIGTAVHTFSVTVPTAGSVHLLDGSTPVTSLVVSGVGTYQVDPTTGQLTFTPENGYVGTAPGVDFRVTDGYGQTGGNVWTATVGMPSPPVADPQVSSGVGTNLQTITLPIPSGGSIRLLRGLTPVTDLVVAGEGEYSLEPATGVVTFAPLLGFLGSATPITFSTTDAYGQTSTSTYTATVTIPPPPDAPALTSASTLDARYEPQHVTLPRPNGGTVTLVDALGNETTTVTVPGQGRYVLDPSTGIVTFSPAAGYSGAIDALAIRVTDAYDQSATGSYQPFIPTPPASTGSASGIVWFDANRNARFDDGERLLAGVEVVLTGADEPGIVNSLRSSATIELTAVTSLDGSYSFSGLAVGQYDITAAASIRGFAHTSDADGGIDWVARVSVTDAQDAVANFAGSGIGTITGSVTEATSSRGVSGAMVQCTWSGSDTQLGTSDDIAFDVIAEADGSFTIQGVPYGTFTCIGTNMTTGHQSSTVSLTVDSIAPMNVRLPIIDGPLPFSPSPNGELPSTGSDGRTLLVLGGLFLVAGASALLVRRRRPMQHASS